MPVHLPFSQPKERIFSKPKERIAAATQFQSTWLSSSLRELRERRLLDAYLVHLPRKHHDAVLGVVAGVWLPVEVAIAHYEACDALGLSVTEQVEIGLAVTRNVHGTILGTFVKLARVSGVTPWVALGALDRLWSRIWVGGAVRVTKIGPKEARFELVSWPCARVGYCRVAMRGVLQGIAELFCARAVVQDIPSLCGQNSLGYRILWI